MALVLAKFVLKRSVCSLLANSDMHTDCHDSTFLPYCESQTNADAHQIMTAPSENGSCGLVPIAPKKNASLQMLDVAFDSSSIVAL